MIDGDEGPISKPAPKKRARDAALRAAGVVRDGIAASRPDLSLRMREVEAAVSEEARKIFVTLDAMTDGDRADLNGPFNEVEHSVTRMAALIAALAYREK